MTKKEERVIALYQEYKAAKEQEKEGKKAAAEASRVLSTLIPKNDVVGGVYHTFSKRDYPSYKKAIDAFLPELKKKEQAKVASIIEENTKKVPTSTFKKV